MGPELPRSPTTAIAARESSRSFPKTRATSCSAARAGPVRDLGLAATDARHEARADDFSGFEVQPSVRLAWDVAPGENAWAAVSRAVRVPTRLERDIAVEAIPPGSNPRALLLGNDDFDAEELLAYEVGYRWQPLDVLAFDLALLHNRYEGLASLEFGTPTLDPGSGVITFRS